MELTILGKYGAYPAKGGATSAYLVKSGNSAILLDCGSGAASRMQNYIKPCELSAIVLTHLHFDHMSDLLPLCYYFSAIGKTIDVYLPFASCGVLDLLKAQPCLNLIEIKEASETKVGKNLQSNKEESFLLTFNKQTHSVCSYSVKVTSGGKKLFYSGDTTLNQNIISNANGCDMLLLDSGKALGSVGSHMNIQEVQSIADSTKIKTIATHINQNEQSYYKYESENLLIAEELKTYIIL